MLTIASALPGRIRLKQTGQTATLTTLASACQALEAMRAVRVNAAAHSLILTFDAATDLPSMLARLATAVPLATNTPIAVPSQPATVARAKRPRPLKLRVNRVAKLGALSSLAASLAWAASGNKRLHTFSGMVFLGFLAVHLVVYRRNLTR